MFPTSHFHPLLVHFPIALIIIGFLADLIWIFRKKEVCLSKMGYYLLITGTLAAIAAWLTGNLFTADMSGAAGEVRETHELFATLTACTLIIASIIRIKADREENENRQLNTFAFVFYAMGAVLVAITGFFGGNLVYGHMMPI
jgi:uncharacterized membrane protein